MLLVIDDSRCSPLKSSILAKWSFQVTATVEFWGISRGQEPLELARIVQFHFVWLTYVESTGKSTYDPLVDARGKHLENCKNPKELHRGTKKEQKRNKLSTTEKI